MVAEACVGLGRTTGVGTGWMLGTGVDVGSVDVEPGSGCSVGSGSRVGEAVIVNIGVGGV